MSVLRASGGTPVGIRRDINAMSARMCARTSAPHRRHGTQSAPSIRPRVRQSAQLFEQRDFDQMVCWLVLLVGILCAHVSACVCM